MDTEKENNLITEEEYPSKEELEKENNQTGINDCPPPAILLPPDSNFIPDSINDYTIETNQNEIEIKNPENNTQTAKAPLLVNQNVTQIQVVDNSPIISEDNPDHQNFNKKKKKEDGIEEVKKNKKKQISLDDDDECNCVEFCDGLQCICMFFLCIGQVLSVIR